MNHTKVHTNLAQTYSTNVVTMENTIGFFPAYDEAMKMQAKHPTKRTVTKRYFTLDGSIPLPSKSITAEFDDIEKHCDAEDYKQTILNFH